MRQSTFNFRHNVIILRFTKRSQFRSKLRLLQNKYTLLNLSDEIETKTRSTASLTTFSSVLSCKTIRTRSFSKKNKKHHNVHFLYFYWLKKR